LQEEKSSAMKGKNVQGEKIKTTCKDEIKEARRHITKQDSWMEL
jgi:hypothetical protein